MDLIVLNHGFDDLLTWTITGHISVTVYMRVFNED